VSRHRAQRLIQPLNSLGKELNARSYAVSAPEKSSKTQFFFTLHLVLYWQIVVLTSVQSLNMPVPIVFPGKPIALLSRVFAPFERAKKFRTSGTRMNTPKMAIEIFLGTELCVTVSALVTQIMFRPDMGTVEFRVSVEYSNTVGSHILEFVPPVKFLLARWALIGCTCAFCCGGGNGWFSGNVRVITLISIIVLLHVLKGLAANCSVRTVLCVGPIICVSSNILTSRRGLT
jgi:hypothetical protein